MTAPLTQAQAEGLKHLAKVYRARHAGDDMKNAEAIEALLAERGALTGERDWWVKESATWADEAIKNAKNEAALTADLTTLRARAEKAEAALEKMRELAQQSIDQFDRGNRMTGYRLLRSIAAKTEADHG
jgi:endonuclease III-like uncharacterized protein